ncbi:MAG: UDP-N-acetylglucosamine 2-epimerase (non-hydrolyzing) [Pseudomonadota bacterium]
MKVLHVVGARPNFMKAAPVMAALAKRDSVSQLLVHTGQHYDANMSEVFFNQLGMPKPDINLKVGSGSHAVQTAQIMMRMEEVLGNENPDLVLVYGDVNSTVAAALVCAKLLIPVGHVEAGLRSFDRTMPEEINRLLTDQIADLLFTPSKDGDENLLREGVAREKIHLVGNVMIDTLIRLQELATDGHRLTQINGRKKAQRAQKQKKQLLAADGRRWTQMLQEDENYALVTLHRPSNVDEPGMLTEIMKTLEEISRDLPVIFPIHPRTQKRMSDVDPVKYASHCTGQGFRMSEKEKLYLIDPLGYIAFLSLQRNATVVITDSGGIQEETTYLGVPCLTLRENTERPITVDVGTNILIGQDMERLKDEVHRILNGNGKKGSIPPLWDGKSGKRIADLIVSVINKR